MEKYWQTSFRLEEDLHRINRCHTCTFQTLTRKKTRHQKIGADFFTASASLRSLLGLFHRVPETLIKFPPKAMSICLSVCLFVRSSVCCLKHVLAQQRCRRSHGRQMFYPVKNFTSVKSMLAAGAYSWHP